MKKLTLFTTVLVAAVSAYGQGKVTFANSTATSISNSLTSAKVVAAQFKVSLYYLPWTSDSQVPSNDDFNTAGRVASTTAFLASGIFNNGGALAIADGITPVGGNGWFQVRAWEVAYGATFDAAMGNTTQVVPGRLALVGTSNIVKIDTGDPTISTDPAGSLLIGNPLTGGLKSFYVIPVPEPTAIGLGILGLGALLFLRRRK